MVDSALQADTAEHVASVAISEKPKRPRNYKLAHEKSPEELAAHNKKYSKIMQLRRDDAKEQKSAGFIGTIAEYRAYRASLTPSTEV